MKFPQAPTARKFKFLAAFQLSLSTELSLMSDNSTSIDSKVWNYPPSPFGLRRAGVHVLNNAGVGYGDYVERITCLLVLKLVPATLSYAWPCNSISGDI